VLIGQLTVRENTKLLEFHLRAQKTLVIPPSAARYALAP
jgi:hypothetical protein